MAAIDFFGYLLIGLGPLAAFYAVFVAPKSFVVLLSVFSAFLWLIVLLLTSALFRGFEPLPASAGPYAGVLLTAVAVEEAFRYAVWRMHCWLCRSLEAMSRRSGHAFGYADALHLALGWGAGHAACHGLFLFASLLPLTTGDGSYYPDACPGMSLFLVSALNCLGTSATLLAAMAVALSGRALRGAARAAYAPAVHAASALLTLGNFQPGGCSFAVPAVLLFGAANIAYATHVVWRSVQPGATLSTVAPMALDEGADAPREARRSL